MAFSEQLANKVREVLINQKDITEKEMFQGLCFMVNGKMCVCVRDQELMCRIAPEIQWKDIFLLMKTVTETAMILNGWLTCA